jgi:hypothetical protein
MEVNKATIQITLADGSEKQLTQEQYMAAQYAKQVGVSYEEACASLGLGKDAAVGINTNDITGGGWLGDPALWRGASIVALGGAATAMIIAGSAAASVPVVGWLAAAAIFLGGAIWAGIEENDRKAAAARKRTTDQAGGLIDQYNAYAVQSASVAEEMRRLAQKR